MSPIRGDVMAHWNTVLAKGLWMLAVVLGLLGALAAPVQADPPPDPQYDPVCYFCGSPCVKRNGICYGNCTGLDCPRLCSCYNATNNCPCEL